MGPHLQPNQNHRDNRQNNLQLLRSLLPGSPFTSAPLRRGTIPKVVHPCNYGQVYNRANRGKDQHRYANGILMPALRRRVDAAGSGERGQPNCYSNAADRQHGGAKTLQ